MIRQRVIVRVIDRLWPGTVTAAGDGSVVAAGGGAWYAVLADCGDHRWHPAAEVWSHAQALASLDRAIAATDLAVMRARLAGDPRTARSLEINGHRLIVDRAMIMQDRRDVQRVGGA